MPKWDQKYAAAPEGLFGGTVNEYVREIAARSDFAARSALCLADGDGRNSRWLAGRGIKVTAVDQSTVACANGAVLDGAAGVFVERVAADLETWLPIAGASWDAAFLMYLQAPISVRLAALKVGWHALAPGGWIIVEAFAKAQVEGEMGPGDPSLMYSIDEIGEGLPEAFVVEALSGRVRLEEGDRHNGLAEVVRFAARKL
jgi:Methyltransferase domain